MLTQDMDASACVLLGGRITASFAHILFFVNHICTEKESDKHGGMYLHVYLLCQKTQENVLLFDQV